MCSKGLYGFVIVGRYYLMEVDTNVDAMFDVMCRETAVIIKKYHGSMIDMFEAFSRIRPIKMTDALPSPNDVKRLWYWTDLVVRNNDDHRKKTWPQLLCHCKMSLIHTLETGCMLLHAGGQQLQKPTEAVYRKYEYMCWLNLDDDVVYLYDCNGCLVKRKTTLAIYGSGGSELKIKHSSIMTDFYRLNCMLEHAFRNQKQRLMCGYDDYSSKSWGHLTSAEPWLTRQTWIDLGLMRDD